MPAVDNELEVVCQTLPPSPEVTRLIERYNSSGTDAQTFQTAHSGTWLRGFVRLSSMAWLMTVKERGQNEYVNVL